MKHLTFMLIVVLFILLACGDGDGDGDGDGGGSAAIPQPIKIVATPVESNWPSEWEGPLPTIVVQPK